MSNPRRARVLLLIPHLGGGGAERVVELLARSLDRARYETHLALITRSPMNHSDRSGMECIYELNTSRIRYSLFKLLHLIWRFRPDVILSGMAHLNLLLLILRPALSRKTRVLVRQNGELTATLNAGLRPRFARFLYAFAYRRADLVICQSEAMKREIRRILHVQESRLAVLPNPVDFNLIRTVVKASSTLPTPLPPTLLAIGRLTHEKGFDLLLEAFAVVCGLFPRAELVIAGSGPSEAALKQQSADLGIAGRVRFVGHVPNPATLFRNASLFVLSSRTEGIPNALLEAAVAGLPIVTTPASEGLVDLVAGEKSVWVASEISSRALRIALETALRAIRPGKRCQHSWVEPFEISHAIPAYEAAIDRAMGAAAH